MNTTPPRDAAKPNNVRFLFGVYRFWQRPWGFHRFSDGAELRGAKPRHYGWQLGCYLFGIERNIYSEGEA